MAKAWLIDGKAFNIARWRTFVHDSLKDMRVFYSDLNAHLNDDGETISVYGFTENSAGELKRDHNAPAIANERDPLYETNRGAAAGQMLSMDGFDKYVQEAFELPLEERLSRFDALYAQAVKGSGEAMQDSWSMIPDTAKLVYTLHLWERTLKGKLHPAMWAAVLHLSWPHGKVGSMMFRANLSEKEVIKMFSVAPRYPLMPEEEVAILESFPSEVTAWRGVSSTSRYQNRGFSWTMDRDQAEWFARANSFSGEPIVLEARVRREAILMYSSFEKELVLNPTVPPTLVAAHELPMCEKPERLFELRALLRRKDAEEMAEAL